MRDLFFWFIGVSGACWVGRSGFCWWQVALVSFTYILALGSCHLVISGVSWYSCHWVWLVPSASLSVSTPGISVPSGRNSLCGTGSTLDTERNPRDLVSDYSLVPVICGLCSGASEQIGGLICAHRFVSTTGRPALCWQYFGMESCDTGSALGCKPEVKLDFLFGQGKYPVHVVTSELAWDSFSTQQWGQSTNHQITWG